jgi:6-phosphogluconolactonase (cycloisomerase 2 family)
MRPVVHRIVLAALLIVIATRCEQMATTPPGPSATCVPATRPTFVYVLSWHDATISMYTANSCTGALTAMLPPTVPTGVNNGFNAESMAMDPTGRFLYVANLGSNLTDAATISMFTIDPVSGFLRATSPAQVPTGFLPTGIVASTGFVYTANRDDNSVSMFAIAANSGELTPLSPRETVVPPLYKSRSTFSSPGFVTVHPSGHFLYVTDQGNGSIMTFSIDSLTGTLTPTNPAGAIAGVYPWKVVFDPAGRFAYVPDAGTGTVWMYSVDAGTGALTLNPRVSVPAGSEPAYMAVHPSGKFAYVVDRFNGNVAMYNIDPVSGTLSPTTRGAVQAGSGAYPIAVSASGAFAYVGNENDNSLSIYTIDPSGILVPAGTLRTGNDPSAIVVRN